ncbi:MAG: hypothetical protein AAGE01_04815 [Pseudomonadota bacterium]
MPHTKEIPIIELSSTAKAPPLTPAERRWLSDFRASLPPREDPPPATGRPPHWGWVIGFWFCTGATAVLASLQ